MSNIERLAGLALELLERWDDAEKCVIHDRGSPSEATYAAHEAEVDAYRALIAQLRAKETTP
jgi:hypothetical protein